MEDHRRYFQQSGQQYGHTGRKPKKFSPGRCSFFLLKNKFLEGHIIEHCAVARVFGLRGLALARDLELRKVALPGSGPIERALTAVVVERFLTLQVLSRHWHGTLRLAGVVVGYNGSSEAGWPETLRALGQALE